MSKPDPIALTARFLEACGADEVEEFDTGTPPRPVLLYRMHWTDGWEDVPDFTRPERLGDVVRMVREKWPEGGGVSWDGIDHESSVGGHKVFGHSGMRPNSTLMLAAIDAAGLERPAGW